MAKGLTGEKAARVLVLGINTLFLLFGIVILAVGIVSYQKANDIRNQADIIRTLDIPLLTIIIAVAGLGTIVTSIIGCVGAWIRHNTILKAYSVIIFIVIGVQIAMGIYLFQLSVDSLRETWEEDSEVGLNRRISFQNYMTCSGFDYWTDAMGQLHTYNPFTPKSPLDPVPKTCKEAASEFVRKYMLPVAIAAIVIAAVEFVALGFTCFLIFQAKETVEDTAFSY